MKADLSGKIAIVTGGTRGIGKSIVDLLTTAGAEVIYTGTKKASRSGPGRFARLDLGDRASIEEFVNEVIKPLPRLDILINNAGTNKIDSIDEISDEDWDNIIQINLTGCMQLIRETVRQMKRTETKGRILNISSIWGVISKAKRSCYSASKTGLIGLTRACALDCAPYDILVNALCPGFTMTDLTASVLSQAEATDLASYVPLQRFATEVEIARAAVFLCSEMNTYMTGQTLIVDGGFSIQ